MRACAELPAWVVWDARPWNGVLCATEQKVYTGGGVFKIRMWAMKTHVSWPFIIPWSSCTCYMMEIRRCFTSIVKTFAKWETCSTNNTTLLAPWSRVLLEKLTGFQLVTRFPAFYVTRRFITAFTSARHLSLSWANSILSIHAHPTSWRSILILSSHLRLGLSNDPFPSGFPTKTLYTHLFSPIRAICPAHRVLYLITRTILGEEYRSLTSSLCSFFHSPVALSLLVPNTLLNSLFSDTLSLRSSLNVSDQVSHPYKTTGKITSNVT